MDGVTQARRYGASRSPPSSLCQILRFPPGGARWAAPQARQVAKGNFMSKNDRTLRATLIGAERFGLLGTVRSLHRLLQLFKSAYFDLANALAANSILAG